MVEFILASLHHPANGSKVGEPPLIGVRAVAACNTVGWTPAGKPPSHQTPALLAGVAVKLDASAICCIHWP